ncbi:MAG: xanthine dehydrogenase family protein molybdopterin-binding subunit [Alphaproteobacteria bacterium]|nr:xanthine dehydrogenase family protein molybdopterin-binding subunit [Alphaproteobacteria bacterium]
MIGKKLPRLEDERLLTGHGAYSDDETHPDQLHAVLVRSPHAHARIVAIDTAAARRIAGVRAVLTGADFAADGHTGIVHGPLPIDTIDHTKPAFAPPGGVFDAPQPPLALDRVRFVGEAVALVVAATRDAAEDGAEAVIVHYDLLPAVTDAHAALRPDAPRLWDAAPGNLSLDGEIGDRAAVEDAFVHAPCVVRLSTWNQRIVAAPMEPRAALGLYDPARGRYTLHAGSQGVVRLRSQLAEVLAVAPDRVRVVSRDTGGGFGIRTMLYPEFVLVAWAARRLGRPVKWTSGRTESFVADYHGRDMATDAVLALDQHGRFLAIAVSNVVNVGAHPVAYVSLNNAQRIVTTLYTIPVAHVRSRAVLTNTSPTVPYRGAGRPEMMFVVERLIDLAARRLGIDRVALRRRNLVPESALPYRTALGLTYESGEFHRNMEHAALLAGWDGFADRRAAARAAGKCRGIAIANYVETPVGAPVERAEITVAADGSVEVVIGTQSTGQGHETSFAQVVADRLGVAIDAVRLVTGDTDRVAIGGGTHSDRSMRLGGTVLARAADRVIEKARAIAAHVLEAAEADIAFADGHCRVRGTDRVVALAALARYAPTGSVPDALRGPLSGAEAFRGRIPAYPNGCAFCEVEIDPETGVTEIIRYGAVDDVGRIINPLVVEGQVHGGIAQGAGQALLECGHYDPASGQLLAGSFMDYALPRADLLPDPVLVANEVPAANNPLGVKGGGEAGTTPSLAVVVNAIVDALAEYGVEHIEMPATPERVWRAIAAARVD